MKFLLLIVHFLTFSILAISQSECNFIEYRQRLLEISPRTAANAEAVEAFIKSHLQKQSTESGSGSNPSNGSSIITIPVIVHILYHTSEQNISETQVNSQIQVLNKDYIRKNADTVNTPSVFRKVAADCGFQFALAKVDSLGFATTGIVRKYTNIEAFSISDEIKFSGQGGDDAWDPDNYLNIWVGNLTAGVLGYSSVVGGPPERDGVVVQYTAFGTQGTTVAPFNGGRTATHEIGHWLNLIHTWGDADCGDDHVADTPPQEMADRGCPEGPLISCNNGPEGDMYTNYMDFVNDDCMNIFTQGQRDRMQALFAPGGPRYKLLFSSSLTAIPRASPSSSSNLAENVSLIGIYPNPASDWIVVSVSVDPPKGTQLEIYNDLGQRIKVFALNQNQQQFNISFLQSGIYFIGIVNGKNRSVAKLVKF
jgi:hypothetical protein